MHVSLVHMMTKSSQKIFTAKYLSLACLILNLLAALPHQAAATELKAESESSIHSGKYFQTIQEWTERWKNPGSDLKPSLNPNEMIIQSIRTIGDKTYIGLLAKTLINAKLADVLSVLQNIDQYKKIYPGLDEISFVPAQNDQFDIHWKFSGPMGTHTVYNTIQKITKLGAFKAFLIYHLKNSKDVLETDGFVFLQETNGKTEYVSVDFFNAKWGLAATFFEETIWKTSFDNTQKATLAIKNEAEKISKPGEAATQKVSVNFIGLADRAKQKTFENLAAEIFSADKHETPHNQ